MGQNGTEWRGTALDLRPKTGLAQNTKFYSTYSHTLPLFYPFTPQEEPESPVSPLQPPSFYVQSLMDLETQPLSPGSCSESTVYSTRSPPFATLLSPNLPTPCNLQHPPLTSTRNMSDDPLILHEKGHPPITDIRSGCHP